MPEEECRYIRLCHNIYVTLSKALLLCSVCNDRDVVSRILCSKTRDCFCGDDAKNISDTYF